jgi:putative membrane protein
MSMAPLALLATAAAAYVLGVRRARRWPPRRTAAFLAGLAILAVALATPLHARAEEQLSLHMVQHLLIAVVAAPLLVVGAPLTLALRSLHGPARARAAVLARMLGPLSHPAVGLGLFAGSMLATHLTPLYETAVDRAALHELEHGVYLLGGVALWWPLLAPEPLAVRISGAGRLAYLVLAMPAMGAVGAVLMAAPGPLYASYPSIPDQRLAGALMWVAGSVPLLAACVLETWRALVREERRTAARERAALPAARERAGLPATRERPALPGERH